MTVKLRDLYDRLPRLEASPHRPTSLPSDEYNCVAWVRREMNSYIAPGIYWPPGAVAEPRGADDLDSFIALFESWGYELCPTPDLEPGYLKIAIYAKERQFHHVAKQLPSGAWSSKIGEGHDIRHERLDALEESAVFFDRAHATIFMRVAYDGADPFDIEERGYVLP